MASRLLCPFQPRPALGANTGSPMLNLSRILTAATITAAIALGTAARADDAPAHTTAATTAAEKAHGAQADAHAAAGEAAAHADGHADDHAHGHAAPHGVIPSLEQAKAPAITALVVFLLVFGICSVAVWPAVLKGLRDREHKIRSEIAAAEQARKDAKEALEQYQNALANARAEAQREIEAARAQATAVAADLKAKADAELSVLRDQARNEIEAAKRAALAQVESNANTMAAGMASKILRRNVNAAATTRA